MSYTIERGKRVLELATADERFDRFCGPTIVYVVAAASNNVTPRCYDWSVLAVSSFSEWNGEIMLPSRIWELGADADGGGIQPWNKTVSGLSYVKSWKQAVKERRPIEGWKPNVTVGCGCMDYGKNKAAKVNEQGAKLFGDFGDELHAAFMRLFPRPICSGDQSVRVQTHEQLLDALYLRKFVDCLPVSLYVSDAEDSAFLASKRTAAELARITSDTIREACRS